MRVFLSHGPSILGDCLSHSNALFSWRSILVAYLSHESAPFLWPSILQAYLFHLNAYFLIAKNPGFSFVSRRSSIIFYNKVSWLLTCLIQMFNLQDQVSQLLTEMSYLLKWGSILQVMFCSLITCASVQVSDLLRWHKQNIFKIQFDDLFPIQTSFTRISIIPKFGIRLSSEMKGSMIRQTFQVVKRLNCMNLYIMLWRSPQGHRIILILCNCCSVGYPVGTYLILLSCGLPFRSEFLSCECLFSTWCLMYWFLLPNLI